MLHKYYVSLSLKHYMKNFSKVILGLLTTLHEYVCSSPINPVKVTYSGQRRRQRRVVRLFVVRSVVHIGHLVPLRKLSATRKRSINWNKTGNDNANKYRYQAHCTHTFRRLPGRSSALVVLTSLRAMASAAFWRAFSQSSAYALICLYVVQGKFKQ